MATRVIVEGLARVSALILADTLWAAVGTDNTAPTGADAALGTETDRVVLTTSQRAGAVGQARFFFTNANLPATLEEVGLFLNAGAGADSGEMLIRSTFTFAKGTADLLLIFQFTIAEG